MSLVVLILILSLYNNNIFFYVYIMIYTYKGKGGGGCGCGSCPLKGGSCPLKGGSFYKTDLQPVPAPLVGKPWLPAVVGWPGVDGVDSGRNYLANNLYKNDPQTMMKLDGGSAKNKQSRKNKSRKVPSEKLLNNEVSKSIFSISD